MKYSPYHSEGHSLLLCSLSFCALLLAAPVSGQTIYDDFNDSRVSESLWSFDNLDHFSESGGLFHITGPPVQVDASMSTRQAFSGDFEFVLDWRDLQTTATQFNINTPNIDLQVTDLDDENFVFIFRSQDANVGSYFSNAYLGNSWQNGFSGPNTSATSGLLKITRVGSTIYTWYEEGGGWILLGTFPNAFTGPATLQMGGYTGDDGIFHAASDWVSFIGLEVFPRPDVKINGLDAGISVPTGTTINLTLALDPHTYDGMSGDWWVAAFSSTGLYWNTFGSGWVKSPIPIPFYTGNFFSLTSTSIYQSNSLPPGDYKVSFALDINPDGQLDVDLIELMLDVVDLNIY
jgi:hypothetical protein